jgi:hypothetical protein
MSLFFFFFFNAEDGEFAWSTRFAIVGPNGMQEVPEKSVQPTGKKVRTAQMSAQG